MSKLQSLVIVKHPRGYISYIRFENERENEDLSANSIYDMYNKIDYTIFKHRH